MSNSSAIKTSINIQIAPFFVLSFVCILPNTTAETTIIEYDLLKIKLTSRVPPSNYVSQGGSGLSTTMIGLFSNNVVQYGVTLNQTADQCGTCHHIFTKIQLDNHKCNKNGFIKFEQNITYSEPGTMMEANINIYKKQLFAPVIVIADFEATLEKTNDPHLLHKHTVNSYSLGTICSYDETLSKLPITYRAENENITAKFIQHIIKLQKYYNEDIQERRKQHEIPILTEQEEQEYKLKTNCYLCDGSFTKDNKKVREHCHITGKYRGAACNNCNLNFNNLKLSKEGKIYSPQLELIIIFHNLKGYDGHHIIKNASAFTDKINVIATSFEKYNSISFRNLKFIDSFNFLGASLDELTKNLITINYEKFRYKLSQL